MMEGIVSQARRCEIEDIKMNKIDRGSSVGYLLGLPCLFSFETPPGELSQSASPGRGSCGDSSPHIADMASCVPCRSALQGVLGTPLRLQWEINLERGQFEDDLYPFLQLLGDDARAPPKKPYGDGGPRRTSG